MLNSRASQSGGAPPNASSASSPPRPRNPSISPGRTDSSTTRTSKRSVSGGSAPRKIPPVVQPASYSADLDSLLQVDEPDSVFKPRPKVVDDRFVNVPTNKSTSSSYQSEQPTPSRLSFEPQPSPYRQPQIHVQEADVMQQYQPTSRQLPPPLQMPMNMNMNMNQPQQLPSGGLVAPPNTSRSPNPRSALSTTLRTTDLLEMLRKEREREIEEFYRSISSANIEELDRPVSATTTRSASSKWSTAKIAPGESSAGWTDPSTKSAISSSSYQSSRPSAGLVAASQAWMDSAPPSSSASSIRHQTGALRMEDLRGPSRADTVISNATTITQHQLQSRAVSALRQQPENRLLQSSSEMQPLSRTSAVTPHDLKDLYQKVDKLQKHVKTLRQYFRDQIAQEMKSYIPHVIKIQAWWRGYLCRKSLIQSGQLRPRFISRTKKHLSFNEFVREISRVGSGTQFIPHDDENNETALAATKIQKAFRGYLTRKLVSKYRNGEKVRFFKKSLVAGSMNKGKGSDVVATGMSMDEMNQMRKQLKLACVRLDEKELALQQVRLDMEALKNKIEEQDSLLDEHQHVFDQREVKSSQLVVELQNLKKRLESKVETLEKSLLNQSSANATAATSPSKSAQQQEESNTTVELLSIEVTGLKERLEKSFKLFEQKILETSQQRQDDRAATEVSIRSLNNMFESIREQWEEGLKKLSSELQATFEVTVTSGLSNSQNAIMETLQTMMETRFSDYSKLLNDLRRDVEQDRSRSQADLQGVHDAVENIRQAVMEVETATRQQLSEFSGRRQSEFESHDASVKLLQIEVQGLREKMEENVDLVQKRLMGALYTSEDGTGVGILDMKQSLESKMAMLERTLLDRQSIDAGVTGNANAQYAELNDYTQQLSRDLEIIRLRVEENTEKFLAADIDSLRSWVADMQESLRSKDAVIQQLTEQVGNLESRLEAQLKRSATLEQLVKFLNQEVESLKAWRTEQENKVPTMTISDSTNMLPRNFSTETFVSVSEYHKLRDQVNDLRKTVMVLPTQRGAELSDEKSLPPPLPLVPSLKTCSTQEVVQTLLQQSGLSPNANTENVTGDVYASATSMQESEAADGEEDGENEHEDGPDSPDTPTSVVPASGSASKKKKKKKKKKNKSGSATSVNNTTTGGPQEIGTTDAVEEDKDVEFETPALRLSSAIEELEESARGGDEEGDDDGIKKDQKDEIVG